jgi:hypothetical protein
LFRHLSAWSVARRVTSPPRRRPTRARAGQTHQNAAPRVDGHIRTVLARSATESVRAATPVRAPTAVVPVVTVMAHATVLRAAIARVAKVMRHAMAIHRATAPSGAANAVMPMVTRRAMDIRHATATPRAAAKAAAESRHNRGAIGPATANSPRVLAAIVRRTAPTAMVRGAAAGAKVPTATSRARIATPADVLITESPMARVPAPAAHRRPGPASAAAIARAGVAQPDKIHSLGACVRAGVGCGIESR